MALRSGTRRRRAAVLATSVLATALSLSVGVPSPAGASPALARQSDATDPLAAPASAADPPPGQGLSLAVAAVPATSPALDAAEAEGERLAERQATTAADLERTTAELTRVDAEAASTAQLLVRRDEQVVKARGLHDRLRVDLRSIAIEWFVTGFDVNVLLDPTLSAEQREALDRARVLSESAAQDTLADERHAAARLRTLERERDELSTRGSQLADRSVELAARRDELSSNLERLATQIAENDERVATARMTATIEGTDLSTGALDAYWRASRLLSLTDPSCGVPWWALAGIGRTESRHGTYRGASVGRDGVVNPPIYGPDLDGSNTFRVVPDSDGGALDATSRTDRAVGPMQFLPGTWRTVGRDGTGDGVADPQNLYDAALSSGVYLCRSGPSLGTDEARLRAAYLTYNRSLEYVDIVLDHAHGYRDAVPLA